MRRELFLPDDAATAALGTTLAQRLQPGHLVLLEGDLGTGKTALARAIIRALANNASLDVPSPSFALVQPYDTERGPVLHADLYRLADAAETRELGLFDDAAAIVLVEWPERDPALLDIANLHVRIEMTQDGEGRNLVLETPDRTLDLSGLPGAD